MPTERTVKLRTNLPIQAYRFRRGQPQDDPDDPALARLTVTLALPPPKSRSTNDGVGGQAQRFDFGTPRITWSTCWPQPAHVAFPHLRQVTCRHIEGPPGRS
jgi:hypothetical protein